jgi:hypothetical protein
MSKHQWHVQPQKWNYIIQEIDGAFARNLSQMVVDEEPDKGTNSGCGFLRLRQIPRCVNAPNSVHCHNQAFAAGANLCKVH